MTPDEGVFMNLQEIIIIVLVAIVVLKPSEVPGFLYKCAKLFRQLRGLIHGVQGTLSDVMTEGQLDEIKSVATKKALGVEPQRIVKARKVSKKGLRK
jgi:Sec-independent protein translocase protein TatA